MELCGSQTNTLNIIENRDPAAHSWLTLLKTNEEFTSAKRHQRYEITSAQAKMNGVVGEVAHETDNFGEERHDRNISPRNKARLQTISESSPPSENYWVGRADRRGKTLWRPATERNISFSTT
jgi:hypothetical protein